MLKGKRGFTLLEILMVMIITGMTLPVVGMALYMLLHVPAKETGKLTVINDVNLVLSWVHEDINRGQFFSGSPGWLKGVHTLDFNTSAGTDQQAWQALGIPASPSAGGTECSDYGLINASDNQRWTTSLATADKEINAQWFQFTVPEGNEGIELDEIETMVVSWKGYGESRDEYNTEIKLWNVTSSAWEEFKPRAYRAAMGTEGWLSGRRTNVMDYIDGNRRIYVLATSEHYVEGCPFLFGWDGQRYRYIDATLMHAFFRRYETTTYHQTADLEPENGCYDLMLFQGLPETSYVNELGLWAVDHPQGTSIVLERNDPPGGLGVIHTISHPQAVAAVDREGNDVTELLARQDGAYWESNLSGKDFSKTENLNDWLVLTLPEGRDSGIARLLIDVRQSPLGEYYHWYFLHYILGTPNVDYIRDLIENDRDFIPHFDLQMWLSTAFLVQYWDGSAWVDYASLPGLDMHFGNPQVVPIDLSKIEGNRIRLYTPLGLREIDYIAVDYSPDEAFAVTEMTPAAATQHMLDGSTADILQDIASPDDAYAVLEQGGYINYRFGELAPPAAGMQRTFVLPVGGYYYLDGPEVPEDKMGNLGLWEELAYVPYAYLKWVLPRYANLQADPSWEYYRFNTASPPFDTDKEFYSLHTNYIKLTFITEGTELGYVSENYPGNTYGGFHWVDRTAAESTTYTSHYYWVNESSQMIRQEWQNNDLVSTTVLARNIPNYDDITFEYFTAGAELGGALLPYLVVNVLASAGTGDLYVEAYGSSHIALRSTTLSRGMAVIATEGLVPNASSINVTGSGLIVDGRVRSFGNISVTGEDVIFTGRTEAAGYIIDSASSIIEPDQFAILQATDWALVADDFVKEWWNPASNEYIWAAGDVDLDSESQDDNGKLIWDTTDAAKPVLKPGVYYAVNGNISLGTTNVTGMVTLMGDRVKVDADNSTLSPFCSGVLLYATGSHDDAIEFSGDGGAWCGNLFAPEGGVLVTGDRDEDFYLFGAIAAKKFRYEGIGTKIFRIRF